jgi:hypothetical protein
MDNDKKQRVYVEFGTLDVYSGIDQPLEMLQKAMGALMLGEWENLYLDVKKDPWDENTICVRGSRLETDEEFQKRIQERTAAQAKSEAAQRAKYERLKKIFEKA